MKTEPWMVAQKVVLKAKKLGWLMVGMKVEMMVVRKVERTDVNLAARTVEM